MLTSEEYFTKRDPIAFPIWQKAVVGIAGAGGLGSNIAISLARAGIGKLIIADFDTVSLENLNRQQFSINQVGLSKVEAISDNIRAFNPFINVQIHQIKITPQNLHSILAEADLLIEALDDDEQKEMLINTWLSLFPDRPIIAASGLAGYGQNELILTEHCDNLHIVGDQQSELQPGISPGAPRVAIVANMQANLALELLVKHAQ
jgi:sulfur carrier protein ThiS adenylyltransferase